MAAIDPRRLRPSQLVQLLNSTPLGEVISERTAYRHRSRAGLRIGDGKHIDLLRYTAWLVIEKHKPKPQPDGLTGYDAHKERAAQRNREMALLGRDIAAGEWVHPPRNPEQREKAERDFRLFCEAYFPQTFHLPWSPDHLKVIAKIEQAVLEGGLFAMAMPRGSGKALALDTPLPTPSGWTTMGEVHVGDELLDDQGRPCRVRFATEVQHNRPCYAVAFSDGERIVCDADHLWTVYDRYSRQNPITLPTKTMVDRVLLPDTRNRRSHRYRIPLVPPLELPAATLPIAPYSLGVWLGDGACSSSTVTLNADDVGEITAAIIEEGESASIMTVTDRGRHCQTLRLTKTYSPHTSFSGRLKRLGLLSNKHIPDAYLRGSYQQRLSLLQGLMDTDGYVDDAGHCEIVIKYPHLASDFRELLSTLGIKYGECEKYVELDGRTYGPYVRIFFVVHDDLPVLRLRRKLGRLRSRPKTQPLCEGRHIVSIEPVESVPVRCIQVDSMSSLYLAGHRMIPTHNTTVSEIACLWALIYGHREFVALIGSDEEHAANMLDSIKVELESNDLLEEDFAEVVGPVRALEGIHQRSAGQIYRGKQTHIGWTAREIVLPTLPPLEWLGNHSPKSNGAIIRVAGITGRIRGMKHKRADGTSVRPALVLIDDPQTDESARSPSQCATRERILAGAILGLAGPGRKIAGLMALTVVRPDDLADRILDRDKHPQWQGERTKMVYAFPDNEALWQRYAEIWREGMRADRGMAAATEFYRKNRAAMDAGAEIAWPERHHPDELSAIQHAMNLRLDRGDAAFWAEYQNEPLPEDQVDDELLTAEQIAAKVNGLRRGEVPIGCTHLTMFIDVQGKALFWLVAGWENDFTGYVIDYGTEPDQKAAYFTLREIRRTLAHAAPRAGLEGSIFAGLERLTEAKLGTEWRRDDGGTMRIDRCLIDANWGQSTDVIYQFCRQSEYASSLLPSHGRYVGASSIPFSEYKKKRGDRVGLNWRVPTITGRRAVRHVVYDTNFWKSFAQARLTVVMGDPGCLSLFGRSAVRHRLLAEHLTSEYRVKTQGRGRTVDEWKLRVDGLDNHWLDCLVGCAVAGSMCGVALPGLAKDLAPDRPRLILSELRERRT